MFSAAQLVLAPSEIAFAEQLQSPGVLGTHWAGPSVMALSSHW